MTAQERRRRQREAQHRFRARLRGEDVPLLQRVAPSKFGFKSGTPEYRRAQRERVAAEQGIEIVRYVPRAERGLRAAFTKAMHKAEVAANALRARWAREWLRPFAEEIRAEVNRAKYRQRYSANPEAERVRSTEYKHANPGKVVAWGNRRKALAAVQSDGTLTHDVVGRLFANARRCPYCAGAMKGSERTLDHLDPISGGGLHGLSNVVICCRLCNMRKKDKPFTDWLNLIAPERREQVLKLYRKVRGCEPSQPSLLLQWSA